MLLRTHPERLWNACLCQICVLCSVSPCCEGEVGTAGWLKLMSSVWESSGGDWGGSCPGVSWRERQHDRSFGLNSSNQRAESHFECVTRYTFSRIQIALLFFVINRFLNTKKLQSERPEGPTNQRQVPASQGNDQAHASSLAALFVIVLNENEAFCV